MEMKELVEEIESLKKDDYENLKTRICTEDACKIERQIKKLEQIKTNHDDFVKSKSNNMEVNKMGEQVLEQTVTDLTRKYKDRGIREISRYDAGQVNTSIRSMDKIDKNMNNFYKNVIGKEVAWPERYMHSIKTFLAKLKIGEMPEKFDINAIFEKRFESIEEVADTLNDYTGEAFGKVENLKSHIKLLVNESMELEKEYTETLDDADTLSDKMEKLEDKGASLKPWLNKASKEDYLVLMDLNDAYKTAMAIYNNAFKNCGIREEALTISQFYYDSVSEIANTGKQAYDDITLMVREMRNMIDNAVTCKDMLESIITADKMIGELSKYVGKMTEISLGYLGVVKNVRVNKSNILPGRVTDSIQRKYGQLGDERELRRKELKEARNNLPAYKGKE